MGLGLIGNSEWITYGMMVEMVVFCVGAGVRSNVQIKGMWLSLWIEKDKAYFCLSACMLLLNLLGLFHHDGISWSERGKIARWNFIWEDRSNSRCVSLGMYSNEL